MPNESACIHCRRLFPDKSNDGPERENHALAFGVCAECKVLAAEDRLPPPFGQTYLCYPVGAAMIPLFVMFLLPIGDCRHDPDHWTVDAYAKIAYLAMLFPVGIVWASSRRHGHVWLALIFCLELAYPFLAWAWLGQEAKLFDPRYRSVEPSTGACFLWFSALGLGAGLKDMLFHPERFEPQPIKYRRTFAGFCISLLLTLALLYLGSLVFGYWRMGEWGLHEQKVAGLWRAGLLGVPLAYFFWALVSCLRDVSREIAEQDEIRRQGSRPPEA